VLVDSDVDVSVFALEQAVVGYAPVRAGGVGIDVVSGHVAAPFSRLALYQE
jgi:hypothetical protein